MSTEPNHGFAVGDTVRTRYGTNVAIWTGTVTAVAGDLITVRYPWGPAEHIAAALLPASATTTEGN